MSRIGLARETTKGTTPWSEVRLLSGLNLLARGFKAEACHGNFWAAPSIEF